MMILLTRFAALFVLLISATMALSVSSQDATAEPTAEATQEVFVFVPHTDEAYGIESVVPDGWTNVGN
ncbi:MAG: hypothetical protein ABI835_14865, partial [Chloroflexota bacterium]